MRVIDVSKLRTKNERMWQRGKKNSCGKKEVRGDGEKSRGPRPEIFCLGTKTKSVLKSLKWFWNFILFYY